MANFATTSPANVSEGSAMIRCLVSIQKREKTQHIAIIYIVTSVLSILGAGSVIIYAIAKRIVRSPEVHPLFHLALADLILASLWLSGACYWVHNKHGQCFYLDVVAEIAHIASFFLTVNYGLNAYIQLREKVQNISNLQLSLDSSNSTVYIWLSRIFYAMCWLIPVVIMAPLLFHFKDITTSEDCTYCLLLFDRPKAQSFHMHSNSTWQSYGSIAMTSTLSFSIVALVLVYFLLFRVYRKAVIYSGILTDRQRASIDAICNKIFLYILVFLICWIPALVVASCDIDPKITKITRIPGWPVLFVVQGLTAPMQGFLNCIVYGWARKSFRDASEQRRNMLLDSDEYVSPQHRRTSYGSSFGSTGSL